MPIYLQVCVVIAVVSACIALLIMVLDRFG
jgi:hypothetical protein